MISNIIKWIKYKGHNLLHYGVVLVIINIICVKVFGLENKELIQTIHFLGFSLGMLGVISIFKQIKTKINKDIFYAKIESFILSISIIIFSLGFVMMFIKFLLSFSALFR